MFNEFYNRKHLKTYRQRLRSEPTKSKRLIWNQLSGSRIGFKFRRQQSIGPYIVDFYFPSLKLIIELDGLTHEDESTDAHDRKRQSYLEDAGHVVLRFTDDEVYNNIETVMESIHATCIALTQ